MRQISPTVRSSQQPAMLTLGAALFALPLSGALADVNLVMPVGDSWAPAVELTCPYCGKWFESDEVLREHELDC